MIFRRLRLQLTGLCALITISILSVFSCAYLFMAEHTMKENLALTFQNQYDTLCSSLKQQPVLTHQYLLRMEQNNDCLIFLWDNGSPLAFNHLESHVAYEPFADILYEKYRARVSADILPPDVLFTSSRELASDTVPAVHVGKDILMGVSNISTDGLSDSEKAAAVRNHRGVTLLMLSPNANLHNRVMRQRLAFFLLSLTGCLLLTLFSYLFTGRILKPLRENQEKQLAFVAGASHELRTPLAVILSAVSAKPPRYEDTIKEETLRMKRLVDELLSLSQIDKENASLLPFRRAQKEPFPIQLKPLEADTFLLDFFEQMESYVSSKGRHLALSLPDEATPVLSADAEKLRQLLEILIENALSYTAQDGHIRLELRREERAVCFCVIDDGVGIPDAEKTKVFERFYRADSARSSKEHFGLGLSIAKGIVEAHRGHITVSDTPGGGCTFRCCFPASG